MKLNKIARWWVIPGGAALLLASFAVASSLRDEPQSATAVEGSAGRTRLELCVEVDPALQGSITADKARAMLRESLNRLSSAPQWQEAGLSAYERDVVAGCPLGYLVPPDNVGGNWSQVVGATEPTEFPSKYSTMVYVVGVDGEAELGARGFGRAAREMSCDGHVCGEVTTALFVSGTLLSEHDRFDQAMRFGLGIDDQSDATYPNGHPPELDRAKK